MGPRTASLVALLTLAIAASPTTALAARSTSTRNAATTRAYIRADYALLRASDALATPAQADIVAFNRRLGQECPGAGAGSPENTASEPMSHEVVVALWSITFGAATSPIHTFFDTVSHLRWSAPRLTRLARRYASDLSELAALPLPNLCSDVRAWSATGFQTVPANVIGLVGHAESIEPHAVPQALLSPYETPSDRRLFAHARRLESKLQDIETTTGFSDWDTLLATLGLNQ